MSSVKVASCNIRDARADDGANRWQLRKDLCVQSICALAADVICFQEMRQNQRDDIAAALTAYSSYGLPESATVTDAPNSIFWRTADFDCIGRGGYWLSEQPLLPGSLSWGCQYIRLANYVVLQHKSGKQLKIINTHLDDSSQLAREKQAGMLVDDAVPANQLYLYDKIDDQIDDQIDGQILCGDMNCDATNPALRILAAGGWRDSYAAIHPGRESGFTYHAFMGNAYQPDQHPDEPQGRIDWIFTRGHLRVTASDIIRYNDNGRFPSDHFFVTATLSL